jgi:uncharacterized protein YndB with AHSA1/START domain
MSDTRTPVAVPALVLRRTYAVPRQRVFDAWTNPELAVKFLGPQDIAVPKIETWYVGGTYRDVRPPERLSMTWRWEEDRPEDEYDTLLTLEFNELDGGTELVLTHAQLASEESRAGHEQGWSAIMDQLGAVI